MLYSWIIIGIVAILLIWTAAVFNSLIGKRNRVRNAWSDIDVQLKRRYDLVPNLIETVKGYKGYEASVLEKVIEIEKERMKRLNEFLDLAGFFLCLTRLSGINAYSAEKQFGAYFGKFKVRGRGITSRTQRRFHQEDI